MEKACFIAKMSGPAIVRPASSDFWKVPGVWQLENFSPGQGLPLLFKISFEIRTNLSWVRLFAPKSWQPCWIPVHKYGENRWMEPLSATDPDTPWATFTLSCSLKKKISSTLMLIIQYFRKGAVKSAKREESMVSMATQTSPTCRHLSTAEEFSSRKVCLYCTKWAS